MAESDYDEVQTSTVEDTTELPTDSAIVVSNYRFSGGGFHEETVIYEPDGVTAMFRMERVVKDGVEYGRGSRGLAADDVDTFTGWYVLHPDRYRLAPLPCFGAADAQEGAGATGGGERHFVVSTETRPFLGGEETTKRELWVDASGRPVRGLITVSETSSDDPTPRVTQRVESTYSGFGDPNVFVAPTVTPGPLPTLVPCGGSSNPGLMRDCQTLLAAKDALRGTGTLNWSVETDIGSWDGVTVEGTPKRVTKLKLANKGLTGMIPEDLEKLDALTELRLSGNSLTGCIPGGLKGVTTNDLSSLNLLYCTPAPGAPTAGTVGETSVPLSWTAVSNTNKYRVEYREGTVGSWTVDDDAITGTSHNVDELLCDTEYQFRLSAYGSGTTYAAAWSDPSEALAATTGTCVSPVFDEASYAFDVAEDAEVNDDVGSVSATDPDEDDEVSYAITAGNTGSAFAIDDETGDITVAAALDHETTDEYTLTVEAEDSTGGTDSVTVTVMVTDVVEDPPPAPTGVDASLTGGVFSPLLDRTCRGRQVRAPVHHRRRGRGDGDLDGATGGHDDHGKLHPVGRPCLRHGVQVPGKGLRRRQHLYCDVGHGVGHRYGDHTDLSPCVRP